MSSGHKALLQTNDENMKWIKNKLDGRIELQAVVKKQIEEWFAAQAKAKNDPEFGDKTSEMNMCSQLVSKRRQSQIQGESRKRNKEASKSGPQLDDDGAHQPVDIQLWIDDPGPLERPTSEFDRANEVLAKVGECPGWNSTPVSWSLMPAPKR